MPYATPQLRQRRRATGQRVGQLAERLGVSSRHLSYVEGGSRTGSKSLFLLAGALLACDARDLMADTAERDVA